MNIKTQIRIVIAAIFAALSPVIRAQVTNVTCTFTVAEIVCVDQDVKVTYTGSAPETASFTWSFNNATIISGSGRGPYMLHWTTQGEKHISLKVKLENDSCSNTRAVLVKELPSMFHIMGGGSYPAGGIGVDIGLSGSQPGIIYKLFRNENYTNISVVGTGASIVFGKQTEPGTYTCKARVDGSECSRLMEGTAIVSITANLNNQKLCMVTFDTLSAHNRLIWTKISPSGVDHYNIYKEGSINNGFLKIAEVPFSAFSSWVDTTSKPLTKSDRYKISVTDVNQHEYEKSPFHKTIHLNIVPGFGCYNLMWNHYEGFEYLTYKIHRKIGLGSYEVIDSVASNVDSYTDFTSSGGVATYYLEIVRIEPCEPSAKSGTYNSLTSNEATAIPLGIEEQSIKGLTISPNPVQDFLDISISGAETSTTFCTVGNALGMESSYGSFKGNVHRMDFSGLKPGLYFLRLQNENGISVVKILKK
jgi:hypothetical protein